MKKFTKIIALTLVLVMSVVLLASCGAPAKKPGDAEAALKENGYITTYDSTVTPNLLAVAGIRDVSTVVTGTKIDGENSEHVTILYFKDKDAANAAWEKAEEYANKDEDKEESDWVVKKSGAMIYYGTKEGIKAAK